MMTKAETDLLLAQSLVFVLCQIEHVHLGIRSHSSKDGAAERCPGDIADRVAEVTAHNRRLRGDQRGQVQILQGNYD